MNDSDLDKAVAILKRGGLVAFPTETVYGLGADASNPAALGRLYSAKGRPADHPVIVHIAGMPQLVQWAREITPVAIKLARRFWPGPLTIVLKRAPGVIDAVTGGQDTVGIRIPDNRICIDLVLALGNPIITTSANLSGEEPVGDPIIIDRTFGNQLDIVIDGDILMTDVSSVISLVGDAPRVLRAGLGDVSWCVQ